MCNTKLTKKTSNNTNQHKTTLVEIEPSGDTIINGEAELDILREELGIDFPNGEYETLAGLLTFHTGKIPVKGDKVLIGNNVYEIIRVTPRAVKKVILKGR